MSKPTIEQIESILGKQAIAEEYLKETHPEYFGLRSRRSRKVTFLPNDKTVYECIQLHWNPEHVLQWTRAYAVSPKGKYHFYHTNQHYSANLLHLLASEIQKLNSMLPKTVRINPETFSNEHIKPLARNQVSYYMQHGQYNPTLEENYVITSLIALKEQNLRQHKNDLTEYNLLQSVPNLFPTLSHRKGTDLWMLENNELLSLDIKTSRWPKFFYDGITHQEAAKLLYERQGGNWFSAASRTYLILPDHVFGSSPASSSCLPVDQQLNRTFSVSFTAERAQKEAIKEYGTDTFDVPDVRVVFL